MAWLLCLFVGGLSHAALVEDPEGLMAAEQKQHVEHALEKATNLLRSAESEASGLPHIDLLVWVASRLQSSDLPAGPDSNKTWIQLCMMWGNPNFLELRWSPDLMRVVPPSYRKICFDHVQFAALAKKSEPDQIIAGIEAIQPRLYWLQILLKNNVRVVELPAEKLSAMQLMVRQFSAGTWSVLSVYRRETAIYVLSLISLSLLLRWCVKQRRYWLALPASESRLGADHGAAIGPVLHFGASRNSLQKQRSMLD